MRVLYLHHILKCDESSLIRRVFEAQEKDPLKGDFVLTIRDNLHELNIDMNHIKSISKNRLKKLLNEKLEKTQMDELNTKSDIPRSKAKYLKHKEFGLSFYLSP